MSFEAARRGSHFWDDAKLLDEKIRSFPFHTTGKNERDFETGFALSIMNVSSKFSSRVITQVDKSTSVASVYCFGKSL